MNRFPRQGDEMQLPTVSGRNLERKQMTFPADFEGQVNLVFIPFKRWHQDDIDEWVPFVGQLDEEFSAMSFYEFPTLPEANIVYRTLLNEGMRAGIPNKATRMRTITLYLDKAVYRQALDIPNEKNIWVYLFDQTGQVLWRIEGKFTEEKGQALRTAVLNALA
jgi:hypothetical protein